MKNYVLLFEDFSQHEQEYTGETPVMTREPATPAERARQMALEASITRKREQQKEFLSNYIAADTPLPPDMEFTPEEEAYIALRDKFRHPAGVKEPFADLINRTFK